MKKILPFINSSLKKFSIDLNFRAIEKILGSLVKKKLIVEGTNLTRIDILKNKKRYQIYQFILKNPGVYFNKIVRELKINQSVVVWHINMLVRFDFIKKEEYMNHEIFFDSKLESIDKKLSYYISKDKSKKIIEYLKTNNFGITKTHLSTDLGIHHNTISKYLENLEELNLIIKKKTSKKTLYFLNDDLIQILNHRV
jgi:predicted transcriptional regulator